MNCYEDNQWDDQWGDDLVEAVRAFVVGDFLMNRVKLLSIWSAFQIIIASSTCSKLVRDSHILSIISYLFHLIRYFMSSSSLFHSPSMLFISYFNFLSISTDKDLTSRSSLWYCYRWIIEMMSCILDPEESSIRYDSGDNFFMIRTGVSMRVNLWMWELVNLYPESNWLNLRTTRSLILNSSFIYHLLW